MRIAKLGAMLALGMLLCAGDALAQEQGGRGRGRGFSFGGFGRGGSSSQLMLVASEAVQKDLGLSAEQTEKLGKLRDEIREAATPEEFRNLSDEDRRKRFEEFRHLSEDERRKRFEEYRTKAEATGKEIAAKYEPKVAEVLTPEQRDRLKQIARQAAGSRVFQDPEVVKALNLSQEQQDMLKALADDAAKQIESLPRAEGSDFAQRFTKIREIDTTLTQNSTEVLSQEQRGQLEKLKGKPFDMAQLRGGGRGRGEGGRRRPASE